LSTTEDVFLGGSLTIEQPVKGFRAGLDAVLLGAAVEGGPDDRIQVLDAGAGVGTAGLCVAARLPAARVVLAEVSAHLAGLARRNVVRNALGGRVEVIETDVTARAAVHVAAGLAPGRFDVVIANPPFLEEGRHRLPEDAIAAGAFGMAPGGLEQWARFLARMAAPGGRLALIHRADALQQVLDAVAGRFGALNVLPVQPRADAPAHRIIVLGRKGSRAPLKILPALVLHGDAGHEFLPPVQQVLRQGRALRFATPGEHGYC
jgi:tRNA1(Val) A37 N6-methylase TrmN6